MDLCTVIRSIHTRGLYHHKREHIEQFRGGLSQQDEGWYVTQSQPGDRFYSFRGSCRPGKQPPQCSQPVLRFHHEYRGRSISFLFTSYKEGGSHFDEFFDLNFLHQRFLSTERFTTMSTLVPHREVALFR